MPWAFGRMVLSSGALAAGTCALIYYLTQSEYGQASARSLPLSRPREKLQSFRQVRERGRELLFLFPFIYTGISISVQKSHFFLEKYQDRGIYLNLTEGEDVAPAAHVVAAYRKPAQRI